MRKIRFGYGIFTFHCLEPIRRLPFGSGCWFGFWLWAGLFFGNLIDAFGRSSFALLGLGGNRRSQGIVGGWFVSYWRNRVIGRSRS